MQKCKKHKKHKVQKFKNKKPLERQLLVQKAKYSKNITGKVRHITMKLEYTQV